MKSEAFHMWREFGPFLAPVVLLMAFCLVVPFSFIVYQSLGAEAGPSLAAYQDLASSTLFRRVTWTTFEISISATVASIIMAYPIALHLSRVSDHRRPFLLVLVLLPFWTSILVKSYAFIVVLGDQGLVNHALSALGIPRIAMMFNRVGVLIGMTNFLVPFVIFPLLANLLGQSDDLRRAAAVMGASRLRTFWNITFPLSLPGLLAGGIMSFVISLGFFVTPALLGGRKDTMIANLIDFYTREALDWQTASAIAVVLLITSLLLLWGFGRIRGSTRGSFI